MNLLKFFTVGAFVLAASVLAMNGAVQTAQSQCCPGPPPRDRGGLGGGVAEQPAPPLNWEQGEEVDLNADDEDARRPDMRIDALEEAKEGSKPIVLYIATESDERRFARAREACENLESCLFGNHGVATMMNEDFAQIRVNIEDLDRLTLRHYSIRGGVAPQVIVMDVDLNRVDAFQGDRVNTRNFKSALERAKERSEQVLERREREQEREQRRANR